MPRCPPHGTVSRASRLLAEAGAASPLPVAVLIPVSARAPGGAFLSDSPSRPQIAGFGLIAPGLGVIGGRLWRRFATERPAR